MNPVSILWLRQLKRYFRSRARMIGSLGQPTLFLLALGFGLGPTFARAGRGDYVQFVAPGIVTMGILFTAVFSGIEIIWDRQFGFLKETLVAPVSRLEIVLGRTLGSATVALIQGSIVFLVCLVAGFRPAHPLPPLAVLFMALIAIMCTAIGTAVGSVLQDMQGFQLIMNFIVLPLFFFSSALFPVPDLPGAVRLAVRLNPLSYGVDGLRGALSGGFAFGVATDFAVLSPRRDPARDRRLPVLEDRGIATRCSTQRATFLPSARSAGGGSLERRPLPPSTTGFAPFGSFADGQPNCLSRVEFGHTAVNAVSSSWVWPRQHACPLPASPFCKATSLVQINGPACRRNRRSSSLPEEIQENLSPCMRKFGKYLAISDNTECRFPLFDHLLRRANRRTI